MTKTDTLIVCLINAIEAAPEFERAMLNNALEEKVEANGASLKRAAPLTRWLLQAINEGVDGRIEI